MAGGTATIEPDPDRPRAATLFLDGTPQSYVDLDDPTFLAFEYVQHIGTVLDVTLPAAGPAPRQAPGRAPLRLLHLGGGAMALPRYVATIRPGSQHRVAEVDAALVELVRQELPIDRRHHIRVSTVDARDLASRTRSGSMDAVVVDVFAGARVPASLVTAEFFALAAAALTPSGVLVMNVVDRMPLTFGRRLAATIATALQVVAVAAEPPVWRGRRFGNLVYVASHQPLPVTQLTSRLAGGAFPARLVHGSALEAYAAGAAPMTDAAGAESPLPPPGSFGLSR